MKAVSARHIALALAALAIIVAIIVVTTRGDTPKPPAGGPTTTAEPAADAASPATSTKTRASRPKRDAAAAIAAAVQSAPPAVAERVIITALRHETAYVGTNQFVAGKTTPNALCTIDVHDADGVSEDTAALLLPKRADERGRISWGWEIEDPLLAPGVTSLMMTIDIHCGAQLATQTYELRL